MPGRFRTAAAADWFRRRPDAAVALVLFAVLIATSSRYGWHRDELYFAEAGRHPAWGYPDQPLFTPLVVAGAAIVGHGWLLVVRLASALASAATAWLVGQLAAELGGTTRARLIAALTWGVGASAWLPGTSSTP